MEFKEATKAHNYKKVSVWQLCAVVMRKREKACERKQQRGRREHGAMKTMEAESALLSIVF